MSRLLPLLFVSMCALSAANRPGYKGVAQVNLHTEEKGSTQIAGGELAGRGALITHDAHFAQAHVASRHHFSMMSSGTTRGCDYEEALQIFTDATNPTIGKAIMLPKQAAALSPQSQDPVINMLRAPARRPKPAKYPFLWGGFWVGGGGMDSFDAMDEALGATSGFRLEQTQAGMVLDQYYNPSMPCTGPGGVSGWDAVKHAWNFVSAAYASSLRNYNLMGILLFKSVAESDPRKFQGTIMYDTELPKLVKMAQAAGGGWKPRFVIYNLMAHHSVKGRTANAMRLPGTSCAELVPTEMQTIIEGFTSVGGSFSCIDCGGLTPRACVDETPMSSFEQ